MYGQVNVDAESRHERRYIPGKLLVCFSISNGVEPDSWDSTAFEEPGELSIASTRHSTLVSSMVPLVSVKDGMSAIS